VVEWGQVGIRARKGEDKKSGKKKGRPRKRKEERGLILRSERPAATGKWNNFKKKKKRNQSSTYGLPKIIQFA